MTDIEKIAHDYTMLPDIIMGAFEKLPFAVVIAKSDGDIFYVNTQTELIFGYHRAELLKHKVEILIPDSLKERHANVHRENYKDNPRLRQMGQGMELKAKRIDGKEIQVEIFLSPFSTSVGVLTLAVIKTL